jgi:urease accessory protein
MKPVEALHASGWHAALALDFAATEGRSWLKRRHHNGPLLVQRPFYPEGQKVCQVVIVHPPGGIAGGDVLEIDISADRHACVQLTTPGAGKWYCGFGREARQTVRINVADGAVCEWLPQENIVFNGALASMSLDVELAPGATFCGWDFTCLGRPASGERFLNGQLRQRTAIRRSAKPLFIEQAVVDAADELRSASTVLAEFCAYGSMFVAGAERNDEVLSSARAVFAETGNAGVTWVNDTLVARWVGRSTEEGRALFAQLWSVLRPWYAQRAALMPRIGAT